MMQKAFKLIMAVALCEAAGAVGAFYTTPAIQSGWYAALAKPAFNPPAWVFAPVWTILYALMGVSLFLIWNNYSLIRANKRIVETWRVGVALFAAQLALNVFWSVIFFGMQSPGGALVDILFLWTAILAMIVAFVKISKAAAWLLVPYIAWVSFAVYLNYSLWMLN